MRSLPYLPLGFLTSPAGLRGSHPAHALPWGRAVQLATGG